MGAVLTALTAGGVVFSLGVPGRSPRLAWLVVPPLALWIGASGLGCFRSWIAPGTQVATLAEAPDCLVFILVFSLPLSALLVVLLRRAYPLRPALTAVMIGLASAAASASLLEICHAFDAAVHRPGDARAGGGSGHRRQCTVQRTAAAAATDCKTLAVTRGCVTAKREGCGLSPRIHFPEEIAA